MYRYSVDKAITYTSEDIVLFKESPFACWMERLTLENPEHGIPPNIGSKAPRDSMEPQDDLADTLRAEGKDVVLVEWDADEPIRRTATLEAMRHGADFIVNGQLALGPLSGSANLLMRTSGYSDLGDYLYVPCNTQPKTNLHSALRLCFLADLLHSLQGQLPPQMLIIRGGSDVVPLQTEDHIYHYLAVKQRFMAVQREFRKHKMPGPAESSHFGRWADCANEVLKQRALKLPASEVTDDVANEHPAMLERLAGDAQSPTAYDLDAVNQQPVEVNPSSAANTGTLAEQARMMTPTAYAPEPAPGREADTLQNLTFIGSSSQPPTIGQAITRVAPAEPEAPPILDTASKPPPPPSLRNPEQEEDNAASPPEPGASVIPSRQANFQSSEDTLSSISSMQEKSHPLDSPGFHRSVPSMVDFDAGESHHEGTEIPSPVLSELPEIAQELTEKSPVERAADVKSDSADYDRFQGHFYVDPCNSSLMTGEDPAEEEPGDQH